MIAWKYISKRKQFDFSLLQYVSTALHKYRNTHLSPSNYAPHAWNKPVEGSHLQLFLDCDTSPCPSSQTHSIQEIIGTFVYYAIAVDLSVLVTLHSIELFQSKPTEEIMREITDFINHAATHPDAKIRYYQSDMVPHIHSDASYRSAADACRHQNLLSRLQIA